MGRRQCWCLVIAFVYAPRSSPANRVVATAKEDYEPAVALRAGSVPVADGQRQDLLSDTRNVPSNGSSFVRDLRVIHRTRYSIPNGRLRHLFPTSASSDWSPLNCGSNGRFRLRRFRTKLTPNRGRVAGRDCFHDDRNSVAQNPHRASQHGRILSKKSVRWKLGVRQF